MANQFILALDQGTTSSRSLLVDKEGKIVASSQQEFEQIFPHPGWVEHDPNAIWNSQLNTIRELLKSQDFPITNVAAIGITNQRETTIIWDKASGEPLYNAIVWQDRRTADYCDRLKANGKESFIRDKTGLVIDAYFSASKLNWLLENVPGAKEKARNGQLCFGTIDTWLVYNLTGGKVFITDPSNASRTMLYNIHELVWDDALLDLFDIPVEILPEVRSSSEIYGYTDPDLLGSSIPISGIAGDQQAALFGQMCVEQGMAKNTYGTGCFLLMNTGEKAVSSQNNLLTTVAWTIADKTHYALEGSVFVGGAAVQWVRDGLQIIDDTKEIETLAKSVEDSGGVVFVPALTGMGAPHWDPYARGALFGITRGSGRGHIARATLEGIAMQVCDIVKVMEEDANQKCSELRVDGGASANDLLMQIQADLFGFQVIRAKIQETTALGAAYLAGLAVGFYKNIEEIKSQWGIDKSYSPDLSDELRESMITQWNKAVERSKGWID